MSSRDDHRSTNSHNALIIPPRVSVRDAAPRDPRTRPLHKLSVELIETYKRINQIYYEARASSLIVQQEDNRGGVHNEGFDDSAYDYIIRGDEIFADRYIIKHRIGKGSFGQVFCAYDRLSSSEVAIKIIKSRKPFMVQAQTEIEILNLLYVRDREDEHNIVRLLDTFIYRNHQCLIFEMLSHNLYDLLKNTRFRGVSLNLIRKFGRQILNALDFLAQSHVDIIHCDLKPENILLKHPRRSAIKIIDFGSSCFSSGRTYTYIQSRFYRSPEVLLGIPYDHKIDMWSLACVLVEMHCGEPLFGGQDQLDQVCRIVDVMGMPPVTLLERSPAQNRARFFDRITAATEAASPIEGPDVVRADDGSFAYVLRRPANRPRDAPPKRRLEDIIGVFTGGPSSRRLGEPGHSREVYEEFIDFIRRMLAYEPLQRLSAFEASLHPFVISSSAEQLITNASSSGPVSANDTVVTSAGVTSDPTPSTGSEKVIISESNLITSATSVASEEGVVTSETKNAINRNQKPSHRRLRSRSAPGTQPEVQTQVYSTSVSSTKRTEGQMKDDKDNPDLSESHDASSGDKSRSETAHTGVVSSPVLEGMQDHNGGGTESDRHSDSTVASGASGTSNTSAKLADATSVLASIGMIEKARDKELSSSDDVLNMKKKYSDTGITSTITMSQSNDTFCGHSPLVDAVKIDDIRPPQRVVTVDTQGRSEGDDLKRTKASMSTGDNTVMSESDLLQQEECAMS